MTEPVYRLRLNAYNGISFTLCEGSLEECREKARKEIRYHKSRLGYPVEVLKRGWEWELQGDPDGMHLIGDHEGYLVIRLICPCPK